MPYEPFNSPQFRWGNDLEHVWWIAGDEQPQIQSTPRATILFDCQPGSSGITHESSGGFWESLTEHDFWEVTLRFKNLDENATHFLYAFLSWANKRRSFEFTLDHHFYGSYGMGNITEDLNPGDVVIYHDNVWPSYPPAYELILYNHLGEFDKVWAYYRGAGETGIFNGGPSYSAIRHTYLAGYSIIKYAYYFRNCQAVKRNANITLRPGVAFYNFPFQFRELLDVAVLA